MIGTVVGHRGAGRDARARPDRGRPDRPALRRGRRHPGGAGRRDNQFAPDGVVQATLPWDAAARVARLSGVAAAATVSPVDLGDGQGQRRRRWSTRPVRTCSTSPRWRPPRRLLETEGGDARRRPVLRRRSRPARRPGGRARCRRRRPAQHQPGGRAAQHLHRRHRVRRHRHRRRDDPAHRARRRGDHAGRHRRDLLRAGRARRARHPHRRRGRPAGRRAGAGGGVAEPPRNRSTPRCRRSRAVCRPRCAGTSTRCSWPSARSR